MHDFKRLIRPGDSLTHPIAGSLKCCTLWTVINLKSGAIKVFYQPVVFQHFIAVNCNFECFIVVFGSLEVLHQFFPDGEKKAENTHIFWIKINS